MPPTPVTSESSPTIAPQRDPRAAGDAPVLRQTPPLRESTRPADDSVGLVCPFCANVRSSDAVGPCPRCTMEDTPTSRRSTGERIGPWFVLQRKNPTAPGLRFNVLLALARRGHVTGKSIVRGPTTGQLWRFASQVKGISRVFGSCWHCSASISPEAISCPRCKSPQDVPGDADAFLEPPAGIPVMREVAADSSRPDDADLDRAARALSGEADPTVAVPDEITAASARRAASIGQAGAGATAPRTAGETIMSARELAAVFSLDHRPPGLRQRAGRAVSTVGKVVGLLALLGTGALAAALVAKPEWREPIVRFAREFVRPATTQPTTSPAVSVPTPNASPQVISRSVSIGVQPVEPKPDPKPAPVVPEPKPETKPAPVAPTVVVPPPADTTPKPAADLSLDAAVLRAAELRRQALESESSGDFALMVKLLEEIETLRSDAHPIDLSILLTRAREKLAKQAR